MGGRKLKDPLVWIDCEMTGLDPDSDEIIEIFCLITDGKLNLADRDGWGTVIHQPKERMDLMDEWCTRTHGENGLTARVIASRVTAEQAAGELLAYIQKYVPKPREARLAGNSVHHDRAFLRLGPFAKVTDHLHYRILDVSSIGEAAKRWCPQVARGAPRKSQTHLARDDILESIEEARYYMDSIFTKAVATTESSEKKASRSLVSSRGFCLALFTAVVAIALGVVFSSRAS